MQLVGHLRYLVIVAIGVVFSIVPVLALLWGLLTSPRKLLRRRNWSAVDETPLLDGLHHSLVDVGGGVSIHVVRTSPPGEAQDKPFMLLVHGFPEYWGSWKEQIKYFRNSYDIVAMDMRGYGLSSKPKGIKSYKAEALVQDIAAIIKSEGNGRPAILMAHDFGGVIAWSTASAHPELISKLVIACSPHPRCFTRNMDFNQFTRSWYMFLFQLPLLPELMIAAGDYALVDGAFITGSTKLHRPGAMSQQDVDRYKRELARPGAVHATVNYYRAIGWRLAYGDDGAASEPLRRKITMPTLLIWADGDVALGPQLIRGTERYVEKLKVKVLEDCSHWAQQDRPAEFNKAVEEFLHN